jgi:proteasomal ATPase-associated factor 1
MWDVGQGKEVKKWETAGDEAVEALILIEDDKGKTALGYDTAEERVVLVAKLSGLEVWPQSAEAGAKGKQIACEGGIASLAYCPELELIATGHTSGVVRLYQLGSGLVRRVRRNEAPVYSLKFDGLDLLVGTAAGLPCRLGLQIGAAIEVKAKEEYAGWEAVAVESWAVDKNGKGVWCAGGEGGVRGYW